jgi:hypothetical protein
MVSGATYTHAMPRDGSPASFVYALQLVVKDEIFVELERGDRYNKAHRHTTPSSS